MTRLGEHEASLNIKDKHHPLETLDTTKHEQGCIKLTDTELDDNSYDLSLLEFLQCKWKIQVHVHRMLRVAGK